MEAKYDSFTDEELIDRLKNGEKEIIDYIMEKYKNLVRKNAKAMFLIGADTEDLLQEGMIGLFKAVRDFDSTKQSSFYNFANICINRQIYSAIKASNRKKHLPLNTYISLYSQENEEESQLIRQVISKDTDNPEVLLISRENFEDLKKRVNKRLSPFEKKVLNFYLDDYSYEDISKLTGKPKKSIDNAIQRIRGKISDMSYI